MAPRKIIVLVSMHQQRCPLGIYSATGDLGWGDCRFIEDPGFREAVDFWIVFASIPDRREAVCAPENTLLVVGEPAAKKTYHPAFYRQFHTVVDTHRLSRHPNVIVYAPCIGWEVGYSRKTNGYAYGYSRLKAMEYPEKINKIAVVCSSAAHTEGQRNRLELLAYLKTRLGDRLVHFGRGFEEIDDKMDAILPYKYHLVLENCREDNYWTERLSDTFLGWAFPVYFGCPNLADYFPADSFVPINDLPREDVAQRIIDLLDNPLSDKSIHALSLARELVLDRYNPLARLSELAGAMHATDKRRKRLTLWSHKAFRPWPMGWIFRLKQRFRKHP